MIQYLYLGRVGYDEGLRLQAEVADLRLNGRVDNVLLLLEHPPVLTLGRNANRSNVVASDEMLAQRGVTLHEINRGGDVTYHGPGQLVGYPIFDLRSLNHLARETGGSDGAPMTPARFGPVDFIRSMEEALIRLCGVYGLRAGRVAGLTGVWCPPGGVMDERGSQAGWGKIGAIGIHVSRGITTHGFAFNIRTNLGDFQLINPCGITNRPVTSLEKELARMANPPEIPALEAAAHQAARLFGQVFSEQVLAVESIDDLRRWAEERSLVASAAEEGQGRDL